MPRRTSSATAKALMRTTNIVNTDQMNGNQDELSSTAMMMMSPPVHQIMIGDHVYYSFVSAEQLQGVGQFDVEIDQTPDNIQLIVPPTIQSSSDHLALTPTTTVTTNNSRTQVKRKLNLECPEDQMINQNGFKTPKSKQCRTPNNNKVLRSTPERSRCDASLSALTKRFVELIQSSPNGVMELSRAAADLNVQKRRIYDITNVLEGINLLEKKSKNNIQWKGGDVFGDSEASEVQQLRFELNSLETKENQLDELISKTTAALQTMTERDSDRRYAYVRYQDIHSVKTLSEQTVIAIKAPPETSLEVSDPQENLQIWLKSKNGEIEVFLCPEGDNCHSVEPSLPTPPSSSRTPSSRSQPHVDVDIKVELDTSIESQEDCSMGYVDTDADACLKRALISEQDDLGPMGSDSFLLQTNDQHSSLAMSLLSSSNSDLPFVTLEPPLSDDDYNFTLHDGEGLADLFDATHDYDKFDEDDDMSDNIVSMPRLSLSLSPLRPPLPPPPPPHPTNSRRVDTTPQRSGRLRSSYPKVKLDL